MIAKFVFSRASRPADQTYRKPNMMAGMANLIVASARVSLLVSSNLKASIRVAITFLKNTNFSIITMKEKSKLYTSSSIHLDSLSSSVQHQVTELAALFLSPRPTENSTNHALSFQLNDARVSLIFRSNLASRLHQANQTGRQNCKPLSCTMRQ